MKNFQVFFGFFFNLEPPICPRKSTECCNAEVELQLRTKARNSYMDSLRGILAPMRADFGMYLEDLRSKNHIGNIAILFSPDLGERFVVLVNNTGTLP